MSTAIWWIRRDLRLHDNPALLAALGGARSVVPTFILDDRLLRGENASPRRNAFLFAGLAALDASLRTRGSRLVVRQGEPERELSRLMQETGAEVVTAEVDHSPFARRRDGAVGSSLPVHWVNGLTVHPPELMAKDDGTPYVVYGAFRRAWLALPSPWQQGLIPPPHRLAPVPPIDSLSIPQQDLSADFPPGEEEALRRLKEFGEEGVSGYGEGRDHLDREATSRLSPYFRFGMLSPRRATVEVADAIDQRPRNKHRSGAGAWLNELIWREFYITVLHYHPQVLRRAFRPDLRGIRWPNRPEHFRAWTAGETGYPVVDAAMRQLAQTGWMHNRARMIVASFLTKDLLVDWRQGERWFMQHLIDGDPAANNGGWQWTAGVGTDAAPYFRVFNPVLQGRNFDPQGDFVRRWIPELGRVPTKYIHDPWRMPEEVQASAACRLGRDYPAPIVDHAAQKALALDLYRRARGGA